MARPKKIVEGYKIRLTPVSNFIVIYQGPEGDEVLKAVPSMDEVYRAIYRHKNRGSAVGNNDVWICE